MDSARIRATPEAWFIERWPRKERRILLPAGAVSRLRVGRHVACEVRIEHESVSRMHGEVEPHQGGWRVVSDMSPTGFWVNGDPVGRGHQLENGDLVQLGVVRLVYRLGSEQDVSREENAWRLEHDLVTGAASLAAVRRSLAACDAAGRALSVVVVDIDRLPAWGSKVGDAIAELFVALAGRLRGLAPGGATVARIAWRRFVIALEDDDGEAAVHLAAEVRASVAASPLAPAWSENGLPQSVTVATATRHGADEPWGTVVARAETLAGRGAPESM